MVRLATYVTVIAIATSAARADGLYFTESFGVGIARGELRPYMGQPMHMRLAAGYRLRDFAVEPWIQSQMQLDRDGAFRGLIGGTPKEGSADLAGYGIDGKYILRLDKVVSAYVRGGGSIMEANGALMGYRGHGLGFAYGLQISGKVRALGFLWTPLFFLDRGPKITGALYIDAGYDFYRLRSAGMPNIDARVGHVAMGFALGQTF